MTTEPSLNIEDLRRVAEAATQADWFWAQGRSCDLNQWALCPGLMLADGSDGTPGGDMLDKANAAHIATFDPPTVLSLLNYISSVEAEKLEGFDNLTRVQQIDIERHVRGLSEGPESYSGPRHGWTCFHCGETFKTESGARLHFGEQVTGRPQCCTVPPGRVLITTDEWNGLQASEARALAAEAERDKAVAAWERVTEDPVGSAERDVGRWVYERISKLMDAKENAPEAAELSWLAEVVENIEEYGSIHCAGEELATFPHSQAQMSTDPGVGDGGA